MNQHRKPPTRPTSRRTRKARNATNRGPWIIVAVAVVIVIALGVAVMTNKSTSPSSAQRSPASASLIANLRNVPDSVFETVGAGSAAATPIPITAPALTGTDGKPQVLYIGAEYCPYCATERWAMVVALSRFGTFTDLQTTHSAAADVYPNTPTFSFHGSIYNSRYLDFQAVELQTNQLGSNGTYQTLETPTAEQQQLMNTYDVPPNTTKGGSIPFIDFGGKYVVSGATYDPGVLQGKTADQIAAALTDPTSKTTQGVIGAANTLTAAICNITNSKPAAACNGPAITKLRSQLQ